jgi:VanZ family protein
MDLDDGVQMPIRGFWFKCLALFYAVMIFLISALPSLSPARFGFVLEDKFLHFIEFSILSFLLFLAFSTSGNTFVKKHIFILSSIVGIVYAISDEIHQSFVPGRSCEFLDFVADTLGIVLVQMVIWLYLKKKRKITAA